MAKLINKTQGNFTIVANTVFQDTRLSMKNIGLLCKLISLPDSWTLSAAGLATQLKDKKDAIKSGMKELEELGYLKRVRTRLPNGTFGGYDFEIVLNTKPEAEIPAVDFPAMDYPSTDEPATEITRLFNNDICNNHLLKTEAIPDLSIIHSSRDRLKDRSNINVESLKNRIGYANITDDNIALDLFELCLEVIESETDFRIGRKTIPLSIFKQRINKLNHEDLSRIADKLRAYDKPVRDYKALMLMMLYNEGVINNTESANYMHQNNQGSFDTDDMFNANIKRTFGDI